MYSVDTKEYLERLHGLGSGIGILGHMIFCHGYGRVCGSAYLNLNLLAHRHYVYYTSHHRRLFVSTWNSNNRAVNGKKT